MKALQQPLQWCRTCNHCNENKVVELEGDGIQNMLPKNQFILNMKAPTRILRMINTFTNLSNGKFKDNGMLRAMEKLVMMEKTKTFEGNGKQQTFKPKELELVGRIDNHWWHF